MQNYSSMKLEFLGLKWAITEKFREYLLGNKVIVYTDNNPLCHLQTAKLGALEQRWVSQLASFDYKLEYRPGHSNGNADALSRQYVDRLIPGTAIPNELYQSPQTTPAPHETFIHEVSAMPGFSRQELSSLQNRDSTIGPIWKYWREGNKRRDNTSTFL